MQKLFLLLFFFCFIKQGHCDTSDIDIILVNERDTILFETMDSNHTYRIVINRCLPSIIKFLPKIIFKDNVRCIVLKEFASYSFYLDNIFFYLLQFKNLDRLFIDGLTSNLQDPILLKNFTKLKYFSISNIDMLNDSLIYYLGYNDSLKSISIEKCNIKRIILKKNSFLELKELHITETDISKMNYELFCLPKLTSLELTRNKIKKFKKKKIKCKNWDSARRMLKYTYPN